MHEPTIGEWRGKLVTVTGAGGFIGSHAVRALSAAGARVRGFLHYHSRNQDIGESSDPLLDTTVIHGDLRDPESVTEAIAGADVVLHFGAQVSVPYSYVNPRSFVETNVTGTLNVALACHAAGVSRLVYVSSSEVYGSARHVPIAESHPLNAQSPYAATKVAAEQLVLSFVRSHGLPATVVRPFNTYGPRQSRRAIVPVVLAQALAGSTVTVGSLFPRRDLTYVTDTVSGVLALAGCTAAVGDTVNLGTGQDISVGELIDLVGELMGKRLEVRTDEQRVRPASSEVDRLRSDPSRAKALTGWTARVPMREGLARTIEWLEKHASDEPAADRYLI